MSHKERLVFQDLDLELCFVDPLKFLVTFNYLADNVENEEKQLIIKV